MTATALERDRMVETQIAARGIRHPEVLRAMRLVPREAFLPPDLAEFAYQDSPLPIEEGQTISQPYIVALMIAALNLSSRDRVLEIGTGSGYAAAVLSRVAKEVYTVERHPSLAEVAQRRLETLEYTNVRVRVGDGTLGWAKYAPYDAIVVAAGGREIPPSLRGQLAIGGRLVIPVGSTQQVQRLVRVTRLSEAEFREEELEDVRFVPLIGEEGWLPEAAGDLIAVSTPRSKPETVAHLIREVAEPLPDIEQAPLDALLERIGDSRVVLLGEATHGTSEFYRMRARITRELVTRLGFTIVAVEADWPDAARIDRYVRHWEGPRPEWTPFTRFPTWMWRNLEIDEFIGWLRVHNEGLADADQRVGFHGLDLYSLSTSIAAVLEYLDTVDPEAARVARQHYGCLTPWEHDPARYGHAALTGGYRNCEGAVVAMLQEMMGKRMRYAAGDGERFVDAVQNARLVANAERYYRVMYYGSVESWNLRDQHMFDTLELLLNFRGAGSRAVVWAHNSHIGNAAATEMGARGEHNIGQLCREHYADGAYLVGFGTDRGTVAAARDWGDPMEIKSVRPAHPESYEWLCRQSGIAAFLLALRHPLKPALREELLPPRLERAIGVIYRPETELQSHYFQAVLPHQFDEYVWFEESHAVTPLSGPPAAGLPDTYPFGL